MKLTDDEKALVDDFLSVLMNAFSEEELIKLTEIAGKREAVVDYLVELGLPVQQVQAN